MRKFFWLLLIAVTSVWAVSCNSGKTEASNLDTVVIDGHPAWILQGNVYEVNIRQYTPEGTFAAFSKHLDRLKEMGVQTLWFMPINPISKVDRKGTLGSYYAVSDYTAINPEYGTLDDWKALVKKAHDLGFKVIIDWVPNHTGADHYWLEKHPDFYVMDSVTKKAAYQFDWTDTRKLNYNNPALADTMIAQMQYWIRETDIDGFRCDVAGEVPDAFWAKAIPELKKLKNIFMLAEADKASIHTAGFDATYAWADFAMLKKVADGSRTANAFDSVVNKVDTSFPANAMRFYFTSNHDENSWNKADYGTMPGEVHAPFAVLTQTMKRSIPMIYSGQEEPHLKKIEFFEKDTIQFGKFARAPFYQKLLNLRKDNAALAANAGFIKLTTDKDAAIYAFVREKDGKKVFVLLNLSKDAQTVTINNALIDGKAKELFTDKAADLKSGTAMSLPAWGYQVYVY